MIFVFSRDKEHDSAQFLQNGVTMAKLWPLLGLMKCIFVLKFYNPLYCRISCSYTPLCVVFADQVTCAQLLWDDENVSCHCVHESQLLSIQLQTCTYIIYIAYSKLGTKGRDLSATYKSHNIYITIDYHWLPQKNVSQQIGFV